MPFVRRVLVVVFALLPIIAAAAVDVVPVFLSDPTVQSLNVPPRRAVIVALPGGFAGDRYTVQVTVMNRTYRDISAYVVDEENRQRFERNQRFVGNIKDKAVAPFTLEATAPASGPHCLILDNRYANFIAKKATVTIRLARVMSPQMRQSLHDLLEGSYQRLRQLFRFDDFNIQVRPCGMVNAFSRRGSGDITLCTETIARAAAARTPGALVGVMTHELGHTLLELWKLPGAGNEDLADEFAVQMLVRDPLGAKAAHEFAQFFARGNPWLEARNMIERGDRHTLSPQRIRNILSWAQHPGDLLPRWNRLLYPHMKSAALRTIVAAPGQYDEPDLANAELRRRDADPAQTSSRETR